MAEFGLADWSKVNSGGGVKVFSIKANEQVQVRFMYDTCNDIKLIIAHEFDNGKVTIECAEPDPNNITGVCKYCSQGSIRAQRVIIPVYRLDTNEIVYWKRTRKWVEANLLPRLQHTESQGKPPVSQIYTVQRIGQGMQTTYPFFEVGVPDNTTVASLGEVQDAVECGYVKPSDFEYTPPAPQANVYQQPNTYPQQNNYQQPQQPTRRTVDTF